MFQPTDRAPLLRLASSLPVGSSERRTILAALKKEAGIMDDTLARADLISGALKKSKTADRGPVLEVMQGGIGGFFDKWNTWVKEKAPEYGAKDLAELRESADLSDEDRDALEGFDKRLKTYGPIASQLLDLLGQIGEAEKDTYDILSNRKDYKLREAVMAGAAKGIHGMVSTMPSGRRQVTDIGRGGITTPGSHGVDAEDLAQVFLGGGMYLPGMIFDMNIKDKTDIGQGYKVKGAFKERKKVWSPAGTSVYTISGAARGPYVKPAANYARTVAMNAAIDWKRSVHVELEYILTPAEDQENAGTSAINMGGKASLETLMGAEEIAGVPVSRQMILAQYYIRKIESKLDKMLNEGVAKATWQAVMTLIKDRKNPWKKDGAGDFSINVPVIVKFLESTREGQEIMEANGMEKANKGIMQARWKDAVKSLKKALTQLSDDDLLSSLHLTLEGLVDDVPAYIREIKDDKDLYQTYLSDLRKTASEQKEQNAMKTLTASERSAMVRLAATLPVGSPERRAILAGCEKLPAGAMRDNCEKSKKDGVQPGKGKSKAKSDSKKDDGKMPAELLEKFKSKKKAGETTTLTFDVKYLMPLVNILNKDGYEVRQTRSGMEIVGHRRFDRMAAQVPDALKKHQFTSEDNPNPKGNDKDGDGKSNEPSPVKGKTAAAKLSPEQISEIKGEMVKNGVPVRFMKGGGSLNIETGKTTPRGANVMHQIVYWNFTKETAKKIADWLGARASFDKSASFKGKKASDKAALIRLAATLPVGSPERKDIIRMATGA